MASPVVTTAAAASPLATTSLGARMAGQSAVISSYPGQQYATYAAHPTAPSQTITAAAAPSQTLTATIAAGPGQAQPQAQPQTAVAIGGSVAQGAVPPPTTAGIALPSATMPPPATPKIQAAAGAAPRIVAQPAVATTASGTFASVRATGPQGGGVLGQQFQTREQALDQRVRELEQLLGQKDAQIKELQEALSKAGEKAGPGRSSTGGVGAASQPKVRSPGRNGSSGFRKLSGAKPNTQYTAADQDCRIDVCLEEWYNTSGSAVPFRRINRGFYRFGDTIVELDIINQKLMARTEDGWNRGKFGPIEKFMMYYENIEREKAGIQPVA